MKVNTQELGRQAEALAEKFYLDRGYTTLHRNYRVKVGELDLVLQKAGLLVFVEVKYRRVEWEIHGWQGAWRGKSRRLQRTIQWYLQKHRDLAYEEMRIEVIFVTQGRVVGHFHGI